MNQYKRILSALATLGLVASSVLAEPNLTIPESFFDFGFAPQNCELSHIFWLKSTGTDTLVIEKVVPG